MVLLNFRYNVLGKVIKKLYLKSKLEIGKYGNKRCMRKTLFTQLKQYI